MVLRIQKQGTFQAGGKVIKNEGTFDPIAGQMAPAGQENHVDHAHVFYQIPEDHSGRNLVFLHGFGQSFSGWQGTPDGREGFSDIFLQKGYGVYLVDQPRRGQAGNTSVAAEISTEPLDQNWFTQWRMGMWPDFAEGIQFPQDAQSYDQFMRQITPDTGEFDVPLITDAFVKVAERAGASTLVTHSQGGIPGWFIAAESDDVDSVVALEPGTFIFPENELPEPIQTDYPVAAGGIPVPQEVFEKLVKKPITIYFGDYITEGSQIPATQFWNATLQNAYKFADLVNKYGGDCTVVVLPQVGMTGNTHFLFQELNNKEIADHIHDWMKERNLG